MKLSAQSQSICLPPPPTEEKCGEWEESAAEANSDRWAGEGPRCSFI